MRFKCGKTLEEIEAINKTKEEKIKALEQWHDWFAWYPVTIKKGQCVWLETIERKRTFIRYVTLPNESSDTYRLKKST